MCAGEMCTFAHGSGQLRAEAAVALGKLPRDYRCTLCPTWTDTKACPQGDLCPKAHGVQQLRQGLPVHVHVQPQTLTLYLVCNPLPTSALRRGGVL